MSFLSRFGVCSVIVCLVISAMACVYARADDLVPNDEYTTPFTNVSGGDVTIETWTTPSDTVVDQSGQAPADQGVPQQQQGQGQEQAWFGFRFEMSCLPAISGGQSAVKRSKLLRPAEPPAVEVPVTEPVIDDYQVVSQAAQQALLQVQLPDPVIEFDPDPSVNKWGVWAVNLPIWLVTDTTPVHHQVSQNGMDIAMDAVPVVTFDMGDGETVTCHTSRKRISWVDKDPWKPSPVCGYAYPKPGEYMITATTTWTITWAAAGHTGTLTTTTTNTRNITISEFHTILVK